jgi:hypothetical protein
MNDYGKLLFADGIYDFQTDSFTEGFIPNRSYIHRPFPKVCDEALVAIVNKVLYIDGFDADSGIDGGEYIKKAHCMALVGGYTRKNFYLQLGGTNCGKGVLVGAFRDAFDDYICHVDSNDTFKYSNSVQNNIACKRRLYQSLQGGRIAFANTPRMTHRPANATIIKSILSDEFINHATFFVVADDFPDIKDTELHNSLRYVPYTTEFVRNPKAYNERQMDPNIKDKFQTTEYKDALVHLMIKTYRNMSASEKMVGGDIMMPECVLAETALMIGH